MIAVIGCVVAWALATRDWAPARALAVARATGWVAAVGLWLTLVASPLDRVLPGARRWRRPLGLATGLAASAHLGASLVGPLEGSWRAAWTWPSLRSGLVAWGLLLILMVTSSTWVIRTLRIAHWKVLHRLVYAVALLVGLHVVTSPYGSLRAELVLAGALVMILLVRLVPQRTST